MERLNQSLETRHLKILWRCGTGKNAHTSTLTLLLYGIKKYQKNKKKLVYTPLKSQPYTNNTKWMKKYKKRYRH